MSISLPRGASAACRSHKFYCEAPIGSNRNGYFLNGTPVLRQRSEGCWQFICLFPATIMSSPASERSTDSVILHWPNTKSDYCGGQLEYFERFGSGPKEWMRLGEAPAIASIHGIVSACFSFLSPYSRSLYVLGPGFNNTRSTHPSIKPLSPVRLLSSPNHYDRRERGSLCHCPSPCSASCSQKTAVSHFFF